MKHNIAAAGDGTVGLFAELTAGIEYKGVTHGKPSQIKE